MFFTADMQEEVFLICMSLCRGEQIIFFWKQDSSKIHKHTLVQHWLAFYINVLLLWVSLIYEKKCF